MSRKGPCTNPLAAAAVLGALRDDYRLSERWESSPFAWLKRLLPAQKGRVGEQLFEGLGRAAGLTVLPRSSSGHDRRVGNVKVEVKLSTAYDTADPGDATVKWLQIRPGGDFDVLALLAVCPQHVHLWIVDRDVSLAHAVGQHGGKGATETLMVEVDPDDAPEWLGDDLAGTPTALAKRLGGRADQTSA